MLEMINEPIYVSPAIFDLSNCFKVEFNTLDDVYEMYIFEDWTIEVFSDDKYVTMNPHSEVEFIWRFVASFKATSDFNKSVWFAASDEPLTFEPAEFEIISL